MNWALIRRDPDFRHLRWGFALALITGIWFGWIFRNLLADELSSGGQFAAGTTVLWFGGASFSMLGVLIALGGIRAYPHSLTLPVSGRSLLLARWITLISLLVLPLLLYLGILAVFTGSAAWIPRISRVGACAGLAWCFALALLFRLRPGRAQERFLLTGPLLLLLAPALGYLLYRAASLWWLAGTALVTLLLLLDLWRAAPATLTISSRAEEAAKANSSAPSRRPLRRLVLSAVLFHRGALLYLAFLAFLMLLCCGEDGRPDSAPFWFMITFWTLSSVVANSTLLRVTDTLPIARRQLLPWIVAPSILVLAGAAVSTVYLKSAFSGKERTGRVHLELAYSANNISLDVSVPPRFWQHSDHGGETITSPDGTSVFAPTRTILGRPSPYYNPYHVEPDSPSAFVEWQIGRALKAVHGEDLYGGEIPSNVVSVGGDGRWKPGGCWGLMGLRPPNPGRFAPARILLVLAEWSLALLLALGVATWSAKPGHSAFTQRLQKLQVWIIVGIFALTIFGSVALSSWIVGREGAWVTFLAENWLTQRPLALAGGWLVWLALAWLAWRWLRGRFERMEIGPMPLRPEDLTPRTRRWLRV